MAAASFNRVILLGRLTRDPEVRYIPNGTAVCDIGLAVNDRRKSSTGEWIEETTFVDVTLWGRTAEIAGEYLAKGSQAMIEGRLKLDSWESDGQKRSKLKVVGDSMQMVGGRGEGGSGSPGSSGVRSGNKPNTTPRTDNNSQGSDSSNNSGNNNSGNDDVPF